MSFSRFGQRVLETMEENKFRMLSERVRGSSPEETSWKIKLKDDLTYP